MGRADQHRAVQPLTRASPAGTPFRRDRDVELQISQTIMLCAADLRTRGSVAEKSSPEYLKEECLVHHLRAAARRDDKDTLDVAADLLLRRCTPWIMAKFKASHVATSDLDDAHGELIKNVMTAILAEDDRGDFYEVRFWRALQRQLLKVLEKHGRRRRKDRPVSLSAPLASGDDDHACLGDMIPAKWNALEDLERRDQEDQGRRKVAEALRSIQDDRHREAYVLHCEGWQIESHDGSVPSLSARFGVTPRTVRNWLQTADDDLTAWRATKDASARSQP